MKQLNYASTIASTEDTATTINNKGEETMNKNIIISETLKALIDNNVDINEIEMTPNIILDTANGIKANMGLDDAKYASVMAKMLSNELVARNMLEALLHVVEEKRMDAEWTDPAAIKQFNKEATDRKNRAIEEQKARAKLAEKKAKELQAKATEMAFQNILMARYSEDINSKKIANIPLDEKSKKFQAYVARIVETLEARNAKVTGNLVDGAFVPDMEKSKMTNKEWTDYVQGEIEVTEFNGKITKRANKAPFAEGEHHVVIDTSFEGNPNDTGYIWKGGIKKTFDKEGVVQLQIAFMDIETGYHFYDFWKMADPDNYGKGAHMTASRKIQDIMDANPNAPQEVSTVEEFLDYLRKNPIKVWTYNDDRDLTKTTYTRCYFNETAFNKFYKNLFDFRSRREAIKEAKKWQSETAYKEEIKLSSEGLYKKIKARKSAC